MKHQLNRRETGLLALLAFLLVFYAYFFLVHRPVTNALEEVEAQIAEAETQITVLQARQIEMKKMKEELADVKTVPIPDYDNLQEVIVFMHAILPTSSEYDISYEDPAPVAEGSDILGRVLALKFTAPSYETARSMLMKIEDAPYRCQLDNLEITPAVEDGSITNGSLDVSVQVTFFEYLKAAPAPETDTAEADA